MTVRLLLSFLGATAVSFGAWRLKALTAGGSLTAVAVGTPVLAAGFPAWPALLAFFFLSSSLLSRLPSPHARPAGQIGARKGRQVLANGGVPALCALGMMAVPSPTWLVAFAGGLAAACADTWATEVGMRAGGTPRMLVGFQRARPGSSGAVSAPGTTAAGLAAACLGAGACLAGLSPRAGAAVAVAGLTGCLLDSLLGATVQERRYCPSCHRSTEQRTHMVCGRTTIHVGGVVGLDNDAVNLLAVLAGAALAVLLGTG